MMGGISVMKRKSKIFLTISLLILALSVIGFVFDLIMSYNQIQSEYPNASYGAIIAWRNTLLGSTLVALPFFLVELSCVRSSYKLSKCTSWNWIKNCYLISVILSAVAFLIQFIILCLTHLGVIDLVFENGSANVYLTVLLCTGMPAFLVAFALGSIPIKCKVFSNRSNVNENI
jgi:hypothetical protein